MREFFKIIFVAVAVLVSFSACRDNDDNITPSGNYSPIRGGFPQGDSEYDNIIYNIKQDYGVYLLYKDVTEEDMNRTWVSEGTGDIFVAGDELEREKGSWDLPAEHLPYYIEFFNNLIFPNISKEFAKSTFPVKIYMINNLRTEPRSFDDESEEEEEGEENGTGEGGLTGTETNPNKIIKLGDFDNWAISIPDSIIDGNDSQYALKQLSCIFMVNIIRKSMEKGELVSPKEFWESYSMNKDPKCIDEVHDGCDKVYVPKDTLSSEAEEIKIKEGENGLYTLGYVDVMEEKFGTGNTTRVHKQIFKEIRGWYHPDYWTANVNPSCDLFEAYIMNAMWYTPEEFHKRYNTSKNTLIKQKYDFVVKYMKETYGIDLVGISLATQEKQQD